MTDSLNPLLAKWAAGESTINGWIAIPSILSAEVMARAGWDSVTIDMQHGTADYDDVLAMLPVLNQTTTTGLVRVPWNDPIQVMRVLDAGAMGVICPMIETADDAARFVSYCHYPPLGQRSFGPIRARLAYGETYTERANHDILALAMIETRQAVESLDAILAVDGLSGLYIGPADLASAYGHPPGFDRQEPDLLEIIRSIRTRSTEHGLIAGIHCGTPDYAARMIREGFNFVTVGSDARFLEAGAAAALAPLKQVASAPSESY